jgi:ADP-heptose:LPS heptosyltransferase
MSSGKAVEKVLVMRFSALGDVAMVVPVIRAVLEANPHKELLMLSNKEYAGLFEGIKRLEFIGVDLKQKHAGFTGMIRLFNLLRKQYGFDAVADLHGVLRTHLLRFLFFLVNKRTAVIDKGRFEKHALTRKENKVFRPLAHTTSRYQLVFKQLGFTVADHELSSEGIELDQPSLFSEPTKAAVPATDKVLSIGFAPFAKHATKMYNLDCFKEVIKHFDTPAYRLYFFGGSMAEKLLIGQWNKEFSHAVAIPASYTLKEELDLMRSLRVMVSMDSANMHLASLSGIPVVSIWGPTHPYAGFYGFNQDPLHAVQVNALTCRPCSVYGGSACWRGDHACMQQIEPNAIVGKIQQFLH